MSHEPGEKQAQGNPLDRSRTPNGRYTRTLEGAQRDAEMAKMRSDGYGYQAIADHFGVVVSAAYEAVQRAMLATVQEPGEEVKRLEIERLDEMYREVLEVLRRPHVTVSQGRIVRQQIGWETNPDDGSFQLDGDGKPIPRFEDLRDDGPVLAATDRLLKIQERRARLLGLDAPQRMSVDAENIGREIGELLARMGGAE